MIYQRNFIKELSFTAVGIFVVLLAVLVSTQAINLLGRAADGRVAIDAVLALVGFWVIGMTPLLLVLTAFISTLTVLTRYWRDSEMSVWLSCGLALRQWIRPVMQFAVPFAILIAVMQALGDAVGRTAQPRIRGNPQAEARIVHGGSGRVQQLG